MLENENLYFIYGSLGYKGIVVKRVHEWSAQSVTDGS